MGAVSKVAPESVRELASLVSSKNLSVEEKIGGFTGFFLCSVGFVWV